MTDTPLAASLDPNNLPKVWHEKLLTRLTREYINDIWLGIPDWHSTVRTCSTQFAMFGFHDSQPAISARFGYKTSILADNILPNELDLPYCCHFFNMTAVIYTVFGVQSDKYHYPDDWLRSAYDTWAQESTMAEQLDARSVLAPVELSTTYDGDLGHAVGLGKAPTGQLVEMVDRLIAFHVRHCDLIQAQAVRSSTGYADPKQYANATSGNFPWSKPIADHSSLPPTSKAVLLIGRSPMPGSMNVLLVLTGHFQDMKSGQPTFDSIPKTEIIATRADHIIEVTLTTAVRFLKRLEREEEAANVCLRTINDLRREAIYQVIVNKTRRAVDLLRENSNPPGCVFDSHLPGDILWIWKEIVEDEKYLQVLNDTRTLRQVELGQPQAGFRHRAEIQQRSRKRTRLRTGGPVLR